MTNRIVFSAITLCISLLQAFLSNTAMARDLESEQSAIYRELLDVSGTSRQVEQYPAHFVQGFEQSAQLTPERRAYVMQVAQEAFALDKFERIMLIEMRSHIKSADAQEVIDFYNSEFGRHVSSLEIAASTPDAYAQMMNQAARWLADEERLARAQRMDALLNISEQGYQMQRKIAEAVYHALSAQAGEGQAMDFSEYTAMLDQQEALMRQSMQQMSWLFGIYTYRDMSLEEVDRYIDALAKPSFQRVNEVIARSVSYGFQGGINEVATKLYQ